MRVAGHQAGSSPEDMLLSRLYQHITELAGAPVQRRVRP